MQSRRSTVGGTPQTLVPSLLSIAKSTRAFLSLVLAEIDLHPGQDQLLDRLDQDTPVSVSDLADQLAVRPSTVSKMLDRLIEKQLVERQSHSHDARRTMVIITPAGQEVRDAARDVWVRLEAELSGSLPEGERLHLATALAKADTLLSTKLRRRR
ncbi:MarR family winged helix-turn-helix transcriptional regulator [Mangrovicella endophytica]|uniref:MarR family winged helix-turn-helix transcriptional regulator n=1 Tax=Mangrovicella endophytica TaxID=2066697 RepID=UPI001FDF8329|nr:MarR family winged helix-turn-helix transcriptional regulator [Mangrovicella endophytica]